MNIAHAVGREHVDLPAHVLASALRPQATARVEVARADRLEVARATASASAG